MEKRSIFVLLGMLATAGALAEAYTWTDENGVVHYSDRPNPGAMRIELPEASESRPRPTTRRAAAGERQADGEAAQQQAFRYDTLAIASPAAEETLWNIGGTLNVSLSLTPALQQGHQVRVYFDATPQIVSGTNFQLQEVYRGAHNLQAEVLDATGKLMIRSQPSRFYVHQTTVN